MQTTNSVPTVRIRDAELDDLPRVLSMIRALAAHHGDAPDVSAAELERDIFGNPPWIYVLVAELNAEVVGYAALCPLAQLQLGLRGIDMHHLFVERAFRGKGIGRQLIESTMQKAQALCCGYMMVGTHPENADAQAVYIACGFEQQHGRHPRFRITLDA